jgi:hypothetical protein
MMEGGSESSFVAANIPELLLVNDATVPSRSMGCRSCTRYRDGTDKDGQGGRTIWTESMGRLSSQTD